MSNRDPFNDSEHYRFNLALPSPVAMRRRKKIQIKARQHAEVMELQAAMTALKARHARELADLDDKD